MNVVFLNRLSEHWEPGIKKLESEFPNAAFIKNSNPDDRAKLLETADVIVTGRINEDEIRSAKKLKIIFVPFTGLNHFPLKLIKERNIPEIKSNAPPTPIITFAGRVLRFWEIKQLKQ